jgi:hypothetical protein
LLICPHFGHFKPTAAAGTVVVREVGMALEVAIAAYPVENGVWYRAMFDLIIP